MGMSIDVHVYDRQKLEYSIEQKFGSNSIALLKKAMNDFGVLTQSTFVLQSADYWNEYCPWSQFIQLIECMNSQVDGYDLLNQAEIGWKYQGENAREWYEANTSKTLPCHADDDKCDDDTCTVCKDKDE